VLAVATIGWATGQPLIFASIGPTAYELVEQPQLRSAKPYNVIVGHLVGLGTGFLGLFVANAWAAPNVLTSGTVATARLWAVAVAAALTTLGTLLLKAGQPAALATCLLIALGAMQTRRDALAIIAAVADSHRHRRADSALPPQAHANSARGRTCVTRSLSAARRRYARCRLPVHFDRAEVNVPAHADGDAAPNFRRSQMLTRRIASCG
jgi:HPP family protein